MDITVMHEGITWFTDATVWSDLWHNAVWHVSHDSLVMAKQFNQDILGDLGRAWNNFVKSGQIWALLIGIIIGYLIRGISTYG